jgi:hypothetical protein
LQLSTFVAALFNRIDVVTLAYPCPVKCEANYFTGALAREVAPITSRAEAREMALGLWNAKLIPPGYFTRQHFLVASKRRAKTEAFVLLISVLFVMKLKPTRQFAASG